GRVRAPAALTRRLRQIGVVASAAEGARLAPRLSPGQRLVSMDGALWRWDGFVSAADAPTASAQRLAQKNRLAELEVEVAAARREIETSEMQLAAAEHALQHSLAN